MNVLIVEDDRPQAEAIHEMLARSFMDVEVSKIITESEFRDKFGSLKLDSFDLILLDVMLKWAEPSLNMRKPPPEIEREGFYRGGVRCLKMLLASPEMQSIPIIIYSVLGRDDLRVELQKVPAHVLFLQKDFDESRLLRHIRSLLQGLPEEKALPFGKRLLESIQAKPGWLGFSVDLKKFLSRPKKTDKKS